MNPSHSLSIGTTKIHDEEARLAALDAYQILDSASEKPFDDLTVLAARVCDAPIALLGITAKNRHWYKAKVGVFETEMPSAHSFCAATVQAKAPLLIPNAEQDERFRMSPLVRGRSQLRFYAGFPLINSAGHALGTLCVMDHKPRELISSQIQALEIISRQATMQMEVRRMQITLSEKFPGAQGLLATLSHELRTPLQGIFGGIDMLMDSGLNPDQMKYLDVAQRSAENLLKTVEQIISLGRAIQENQVDVRKGA